MDGLVGSSGLTEHAGNMVSLKMVSSIKVSKGGIGVTQNGQQDLGINGKMVMFHGGRVWMAAHRRNGAIRRRKNVNKVVLIFGAKVKGSLFEKVFIVGYFNELNKRREVKRRGHKAEQAIEPTKNWVLSDSYGVKSTSLRRGFGGTHNKREEKWEV